MAVTRWATAAAVALGLLAATVVVASLTSSGEPPARLLGVGVGLSIAMAAREAVRDDALGWTAVVGVSSLAVAVLSIPLVFGLEASSARPEWATAALLGLGATGLALAAGRSVHAVKLRNHPPC